MKNLLKTCVISIAALALLSGCVVYEPRPRVYAYPAYEVYDGPTVVYVHSYYGGYWHRGCWR
jgi:hypothetical protein